jgi:hypothetical protein
MLKEALHVWVLKKEVPFYYFGRFFYRKNAPDYRKFMSLNEFNKLIAYVDYRFAKVSTIKNVLQDKLFFSYHCDKYNISTPEVVSYNFENRFFINGQVTVLKNAQDALDFFKLRMNDLSIDKLFLKLTDNKSGVGAILMRLEKLEVEIDSIWIQIKDKYYIHQRVISQHPEINNIYSNSINTLRIETYIDQDDLIHFLGTYMRFGSGSSHVDNTNQGGFYVSVNLDTGTLFKMAKTNLIFGAKDLDRHPDTKFVFEDFKIPYFEESLDLVRHACKYMPGFVGAWDIAITPIGPTIIEGNHRPSFLTGEWSYHGYKNKPIFKEIFSLVNQYHKTK